MKLSLIDATYVNDHPYINVDDKCIFGLTYTAYKGFSYSTTNQLIYNFKISPDKRGTFQWRHKITAIKEVAQIFDSSISRDILDKVTFIPIPPSKCKTDALYDNRITWSLNEAFGDDADVRDLLVQIESRRASHLHNDSPRPSPDELYNNLDIDTTLCENIKPNIILVDDVITTGAHFIASRRKLLEKFPKANIIGVFIARRGFEEE